MNIPNWQHQENQKEANRLRDLGFRLEVNADGYRVWFKDVWLCGAGVLLPRRKRLHWCHARANIRDFLASAVWQAKRSQYYDPKNQ